MLPGWGVGGMFGGVGGPMIPRRFEEQYHVYSVAVADKAHLEVCAYVRPGHTSVGFMGMCKWQYRFFAHTSLSLSIFFSTQKGDKILLPPSAFDTLARLQVDYPMLFRLTSEEQHTTTHCGVLEFTAEEGCCYIPHWMMQNLLVTEGSLLTVTNVSLPKATFVKLQPQSTDFLEISNPRAVLEHALRNYSCVTLHDIIQIPYNSKIYQFELKDVQPGPAACIIETDCQVDFDPPVGYVEPQVRSRTNSVRSSQCPSPATTNNTQTTSVGGGAVEELLEQTTTTTTTTGSSGIRIVDGQIIRPEDTSDTTNNYPVPELLAPKTGATGVQKNAAIPEVAPEADYWAYFGDNAQRLDGKPPAVLKDVTGNPLDVRALRAQAAAKRASEQQQAQAQQKNLEQLAGKTVTGQAVQPMANTAGTTAPVSKRQSRIGSKYSRLKNSAAFQGSANQFH
jgi:ubiquitin fusion degradation protein 1